jgi:carbon storage regulator
MLVLSRKESQRIKLGDSIVVTVIRVAGDRVRLGIDAPPEMLVLREELEERPAPPATMPAACGRLAGHGGSSSVFSRTMAPRK